MKVFKTAVSLVLGLVVLCVAGWVLVNYYDIIFAKTVYGKVEDVQRVDANLAIVSRDATAPNPQVFSYAVAIREKGSSQVITASSEDRQWAVVKPGQCVEAKLLVYPPWVIRKDGTYHGARLDKLEDCP